MSDGPASPPGLGPRLDFLRYLRTPERGPAVAPLVILLQAGALLLLFALPVATVPGEAVALPAVEGVADLRAPTAVVTVRAHGLLIFEGENVAVEQLGPRLRRARGDTPTEAAVLLIRFDGAISLEAATAIWEQARAAGYGTVQIAAEPKTPPAPPA